MAGPPGGSSSSVHTSPATGSPPAASLWSGNTEEQRHSHEADLYHSVTRLLNIVQSSLCITHSSKSHDEMFG